MHKLRSTFLLMALFQLSWTADAAPESQAQSAALAQQLLVKAEASFRDKQLGLALLQFSQAQRLHPQAADASALAPDLITATDAEAALLERGLTAADTRDLPTVLQVVRELRLLDTKSSAALEVTLRYQAALADHGGAFPRARWADFQPKPVKE